MPGRLYYPHLVFKFNNNAPVSSPRHRRDLLPQQPSVNAQLPRQSPPPFREREHEGSLGMRRQEGASSHPLIQTRSGGISFPETAIPRTVPLCDPSAVPPSVPSLPSFRFITRRVSPSSRFCVFPMKEGSPLQREPSVRVCRQPSTPDERRSTTTQLKG